MLKNKVAKRIISLLLVYVLAFSAIMPAFAEEANVSEAASSIEALTEPVTPEVQSITAQSASIVAQSASTVGQSAYEYMSYLGNTIGTRVAGSVYAMQARDYIKGEFEKMPGLSSVVVQPFTNGSKQLNNVIATKTGASNRTIYIGAHYDSVSSGGSKGLDDNASGVGVLLETAKAVAQLNTAYTIKFISFDSEESGLRGSNYYVSQMTAEDKKNAVVMINMDSLAVGDNMHIYGSAGTAGFARDQGLAIAARLGLNVTTQPGNNPKYPAGTTGDWSDHVAFKKAGIPYGYLEATNWTLGAKDGYTQTVKDGEVWHTGKDNLTYIQSNYPGRIEEHLSTFTQLLTTLVTELKEPEPAALTLSSNIGSMTQKKTIDVEFELPSTIIDTVTDMTYLKFTYGGKPLTEWKKWSTAAPAGYKGNPFIYLEGTPTVETTATGKKLKAKITFDQIYGTTDLSGTFRSRYPEMIGTYDLAVLSPLDNIIAKAPIRLNPYDSFHTYDEIKPAIDEITANAKTGRYIETRVLGQSVQGRNIYFTILAKDKASVDQYVNETLPAMINDPKELQSKVKSGKLSDYKVPIWLNNIHPDEAPGIDAILNIFKSMSKEDTVTYSTYSSATQKQSVTLNVDQALNNVIFLMNYTENPDGRFLNTRANADGFDLNRDNSNQTQPETQIVTSEIAKWSPLTFLDFHGFVGQFLIEPCTPPHDPNFEFDLLIDNMVEQANAMGKAGTANTKYSVYHIPYEEARKKANDPDYKPIANATGWDDASPAYTAVYAMHQGSLGHTLEIPELNEDSTNALYYAAMAATKYVIDNKKKLFLNQLEIYKRGIDGIDSYNVDKYLVNAKYQEIGRPREGEFNFFPEYYVLPVEKGLQKNALETHKMVQYLLRNGVKVEKTTSAVTVGSKVYPAGTYVVNMHQAKRGYANLVLYDGIDVSDFTAMYADIIQSFSYMRGFDRDIIHEANVFAGKTAQVTSVTIPKTTITGNTTHYVIKNTNNDAIQAVNEMVLAKQSVTLLTYGGAGYETGDFLVSYSNLRKVQAKYLLDVVPFKEGGDTRGKVLKTPKVSATGVPAYVLKQLGFTVITDQATSDVLVNTSSSNSYISAGKPYIGFGRSVMSTLKSSNLLPGFNFGTTGNAHEGLFKVNLDQTSVITAPYDASDYLYTISGSYITAVPTGAKVIATISDSADFFKAGWWPNHDNAKGKTLAFTYKTSSLNVTVFSNELTNRDHPQFQFRLLANAIYAAEPDLGLGDVVDDGTGESIPRPSAPPAPNVTMNDATNVVTGLTTAMEYKLDSADYVMYNAAVFNALDLSGSHTLLVRFPADEITGAPAGFATTLTFTPTPGAPAAPTVTLNDATNVVTGLTTAMEYKLDNAAYVMYDAAVFNALDLSGSHTLLVRFPADEITGAPAGSATTLIFTPTPGAPAAPTVTLNDATNVVTGLTTAMEYKLDNAAYVMYDAAVFNALDLSGSHTLLVRFPADEITGAPAGSATTLIFTPTPGAPAAPTVTLNDATNVVTGLTTAMEYKLDSADYVMYNAAVFNALDLSGSHTLLVRFPADVITGAPAGLETTLIFTPTPGAPAAPTVTLNDATNVVTGLTTAMEYKLDNAAYVMYNAAVFNALDLSGSHTLIVRFPADEITGAPAGLETTLIFTPTPATPTPAPVTPAPVPTPTSTPTPAPALVVDKGTVSIPAAMLTVSTNGTTTVTLPANTSEIKLPSNTVELLAESKLEVKTEQVSLNIPTNLIKQLTGLLSAAELKDSSISLKLNPLSESQAQDILNKSLTSPRDTIKRAGDVYEFSLSITSANGASANLSKFSEPITIRLKVNSSSEMKLTGVYYISDSGELEYIGGEFVNGELVAKINHFSKYAVLEVNKNFDDVASTYWASSVIKELAAKQIVKGITATTFEPAKNVTRAEFVSLLVRALKLTEKGTIVFNDVSSKDWYADVISIAANAGIVNGKSANLFEPNAQISREEMVTIMMRAYAIVKGSSLSGVTNSSFTDEGQVSTWALQYVKSAASLNLIKGRTSNTFDPQGITTRAEAAQMIYNLLNV